MYILPTLYSIIIFDHLNYNTKPREGQKEKTKTKKPMGYPLFAPFFDV